MTTAYEGLPVMTDHMAPARDLPDGTIVRHEGDDYIAYPEHEVCGQLVRWHSKTTIAADRAMDAMLDDGGQAIGLDLDAVAEFKKLTGIS